MSPVCGLFIQLFTLFGAFFVFSSYISNFELWMMLDFELSESLYVGVYCVLLVTVLHLWRKMPSCVGAVWCVSSPVLFVASSAVCCQQ